MPILAQIDLPAAATDCGVATATPQTCGLRVNNRTAGEITVTVQVVKNGDAPGVQHNIETLAPIPANGVLLCEGITLSTGDKFRVTPSAVGCTGFAYGL